MSILVTCQQGCCVCVRMWKQPIGLSVCSRQTVLQDNNSITSFVMHNINTLVVEVYSVSMVIHFQQARSYHKQIQYSMRTLTTCTALQNNNITSLLCVHKHTLIVGLQYVVIFLVTNFHKSSLSLISLNVMFFLTHNIHSWQVSGFQNTANVSQGQRRINLRRI